MMNAGWKLILIHYDWRSPHSSIVTDDIHMFLEDGQIIYYGPLSSIFHNVKLPKGNVIQPGIIHLNVWFMKLGITILWKNIWLAWFEHISNAAPSWLLTGMVYDVGFTTSYTLHQGSWYFHTQTIIYTYIIPRFPIFPTLKSSTCYNLVYIIYLYIY